MAPFQGSTGGVAPSPISDAVSLAPCVRIAWEPGVAPEKTAVPGTDDEVIVVQGSLRSTSSGVPTSR